WKVKKLSSRKWWYPPYKPYNFLKWIRFIILYFESKVFINEVKPNIVIGFLHGVFYSGFAAFVSKRIKKPFAVFYHDRTETLHYSNNLKMQEITYRHNAYVINQAQVVWTVSPQLIYKELRWKNKFKVLYPIPEVSYRKAFWKEEFAKK